MAGHDHHEHASSNEHLIGRNLGIALAITSAIFIIEVAGGIYSNSLSLLSDAAHVASDLLSITVTYFAFQIALKPPKSRRTFGYHRAEVFAAALNGASLVLISILIVWEAIGRSASPPAVNAPVMFFVSLVGLAANVWVVLALRGHENLNVKSAYLHAFGDAISSLGVIIAGILIQFTGIAAIDIAASIIITLIILVSAYRLLRSSFRILFEFSPVGMTQEKVVACIKETRGVQAVHDVHVWSICSDIIYVTAHVVVDDEKISRTAVAYGEIERRLEEKLGVSHATIQFETKNYLCGKSSVCEVRH